MTRRLHITPLTGNGMTTEYRALAAPHMGSEPWVRLPELPHPKWVSADDTRRFVVSFHDLQRAHLIAALADIDHVDAMWMTICMDCEPALAQEDEDDRT